MLLEVANLTVSYDKAMLINDLSMSVDEGELVSLVGPNGAGKTTLLRAVAGLVKWEKESLKGTVGGKITLKGEVEFGRENISRLRAHEIVRRGLVLCPERGRPFREMNVRENLEVGAHLCTDKGAIEESLQKVFQLFPVLEKRQNQISGTISGGERTMLAIGRCLMAQAKFLLIDEPSVGLAPLVKEHLFDRIKDVHGMGITILLTEQDISFAFDLATRHYVLSQGQMMAQGSAEELLADEVVRQSYLGL